MADSAPSKDTQEEKPQHDSIEDWYGTTDWPSCLNLDVHRTKSDSELYTGNVVLSCMKVPKDEGPGEPEQEPSCPRYTCISGPTRRRCSTISSRRIYRPIQCPNEGQAGGATRGKNLELESHKCRAKSYEDFKDIDLCCPPEVLQDVTLKMEKLLAPRKQQLSAVDPQEANLDHQTPKTPRDHRTSRRISRSSRERHNLGNPTPMLDQPTPTHIPLCLGTSPGYQPPGLGQESSQGWMTAVGAVGAVGAVVGLGYLGVRWWRGQRGRRKERRSRKKALRAEERLGKGEDGVGGTQLM